MLLGWKSGASCCLLKKKGYPFTFMLNTHNQGWQYGKVRWNGTPQFLLRSTVRFFCNGAGTVRWCGTSIL